MALSLQFYFGRLLNKGELVTNAKVNGVVKGVSATLLGQVGNADLAPAAVDPTKTQQGAYWYAAATLAASTYTGVWAPAVSSYVDGLVLTFKASAGNAGAVNLDAGPGAKPLRKWNGRALESGDIGTGQMVSVRYNSTLVAGGCWEVVGVPGQALRDDYRWGGTATAVITTTTAYSIACADAPGGYVAGLTIGFNPGVNNTGTVTLNVNTLGAKGVVDNKGNALVSGQLTGAMTAVVVVYDGTQFVVVSPLAVVYAPAEGLVASGRNITVKSASVSTVTIAADELVVKNGSNGRTVLLGGVSLTADIGLGVALNGLDAGVEASSTWYYLWVISDGVNVAALLSTSASAPTLPGIYFFKALVGVVRNDGSSNFVTFWQQDRKVFVLDTNNAVFTATTGVNGVWTSVSLTTFVPPIARRVQGRIGCSDNTGGGNWAAAVAGDNAGMGSSGGAGENGVASQDGFFGAAPYDAPLVTAQTVFWNAGNNRATAYRMSVCGYVI